MVNINYRKCNGVSKCAAEGVCISVCGLNAITEEDNKIIIGKNCVGCGLCVMNCPNEAITL